ncbi:AraC-type DNA-binding protein [Flavobacterium succinicans]|uniref:AraC-type DNA-binding protein n=1 Tax=Flavobacterium succinicans TaxID=29536 RepID=A0A1I4ZMG2_9FLAO|nr:MULTISPECIES: AraC family transcriptional regulator [Flavobacterium]OOV25459.1 AraC family transcriptional regulator [Flavobacterium sp. LM5]SFN51445.1 AraC-type DNA-binding protein [Flavobacterium succinicans]
MKLISRIVEQQQPILSLETVNYYQLKSHFYSETIQVKNGETDQITFQYQIADGVMIVYAQMFFAAATAIEVQIVGESIVMNFFSSSHTVEQIEHLAGEKNSVEHTHNIFYASNFKVIYTVPAFQKLDCFSIILAPDYYSKLIDANWALHESFSQQIKSKITSYLSMQYASFNSGIQWILHEIKTCKFEGVIKKMYLESKIKELLIFQLEILTSTDHKIVIEDGNRAKLDQAKVILQENYTNAPSLSELSRIIALNEFKLKKGFKSCFNCTIKTYVTQLRMERAKELLKNKILNVSEVAYQCGYKDVSHFSAAFKQFYGFTPVSFRQKQ